MLAVDPHWLSLELAKDALQLQGRVLLHAGPPMRDYNDLVRPVLNSAVMAVLFEHWAETEEEAEALILSSQLELRAAQDCHAVVPLADVLSPSMWVQVVGDRSGRDSVACSPLNGGAGPVMRAGQRTAQVLAHLRWINGEFAEVLRSAIDSEIPLLELADLGLALGDDCHGRTSNATAALGKILAKRLPVGSAGVRCRRFLETSPSFFLNLWMAATKCMMRSAEGIRGSAVLTAAGGNGASFGIKIADSPEQWFTTPAEPPLIPSATTRQQERSLGAIGDSAVVDMFGLGAMTWRNDLASDPPYAEHFPQSIGLSKRLLMQQHPRLKKTKPLTVLSARTILSTQEAPIVSLGVLDKLGTDGRLGGGFYRPPVSLFETACSGCEHDREAS
jgi:hypothetical protein